MTNGLLGKQRDDMKVCDNVCNFSSSESDSSSPGSKASQKKGLMTDGFASKVSASESDKGSFI